MFAVHFMVGATSTGLLANWPQQQVAIITSRFCEYTVDSVAQNQWENNIPLDSRAITEALDHIAMYVVDEAVHCDTQLLEYVLREAVPIAIPRVVVVLLGQFTGLDMANHHRDRDPWIPLQDPLHLTHCVAREQIWISRARTMEYEEARNDIVEEFLEEVPGALVRQDMVENYALEGIPMALHYTIYMQRYVNQYELPRIYESI